MDTEKNKYDRASMLVMFLAVCICVAIVYNNRSNIIAENALTRIDLTTSIYKVSNTCIRDYYVDNLTEDGYVFSLIPPTEDCEATHLHDVVRSLTGYETQQELDDMASFLFNAVTEVGGNATFLESCILINNKTGEIIKDVTEDVRNGNMYKFLNTPKSDV